MIDKIHAGAEEVKKRRGRPPKQKHSKHIDCVVTEHDKQINWRDKRELREKRSVIQINNKKVWE